ARAARGEARRDWRRPGGSRRDPAAARRRIHPSARSGVGPARLGRARTEGAQRVCAGHGRTPRGAGARVLSRADGSRVRADRGEPGAARALDVGKEKSVIRAWFLAVVVLATGMASAQPPPPPQVVSSVDRTAIWISDRVTYSVDLVCAPGVDVLLD